MPLIVTVKHDCWMSSDRLQWYWEIKKNQDIFWPAGQLLSFKRYHLVSQSNKTFCLSLSRSCTFLIRPKHQQTSVMSLSFFVFTATAPMVQDLLMHEISRWQTTTHHSQYDSSGRVISSSQRPLPDNTQHLQHTNIHVPRGTRTHNLSRRAAADLRLGDRAVIWGRRCHLVHWCNWKQRNGWNIQNWLKLKW